jgi:hypothetical protein
MGMASPPSTYTVYHIDSVEVHREPQNTSGSNLPYPVFLALYGNPLHPDGRQSQLSITTVTYDLEKESRNREGRRGHKQPKKKAHGPQQNWWNKR